MPTSLNIGFVLVAFVAGVFLLSAGNAVAQSKPQKTDVPKGNQKKNTRPDPREEEERKRAEEEKNAIIDDTVEKVEAKIVNVDTVVYNKKTGRIVAGLKKENFQIFENGIKQNMSGFATPDSPITVSLVVEYSKWTEIFGSASGGYFEPGTYEVIRPVAYFLSRFIKPPDDYASVIAFDMRPTPITDFTNDPARLNDTVNLLLRNSPAFRENNLYDAIKFALIGGKGDSVVLENSKTRTAVYGGMADVKSKRRAILLIASGIDTFSKVNFDEVRRIIQEAGVPIYIISTANLFCKKYCDYLDPSRVMIGMPDRMTFLQARNTLDTFAKESGGVHYPMTFESEVPGYLNSINGLLRSQYSLSYDLTDSHQPGKRYKIEVKVDVDGDGQTDEKTFVVQHRPFYTMPKADTKKK